jgi:DNA-directed RNA polymerase subunit N (RpoN/RPB10)
MTILLEGGFEIPIIETWQEYSSALHYDKDDDEVMLSLGYGKYISIIKSKIVAVKDIPQGA